MAVLFTRGMKSLASALEKDINKVLISEEDLHAGIATLAAEIRRDYEGKDLLLIGVLKGAVIFLSDLSREIALPLEMDFMAVSSYGDRTQSSGVVRILKDLDESIEGRNVLIVEDIIDSGLTLHYLLKTLQTRNPASLKVAVLLDKAERREIDVQIDYRVFEIPDEFVVGYGLDFKGLYRNLPYLAILKPEAYL